MTAVPRLPMALLMCTHPGPSLAVTTVAVALGVTVGLDPLRLLLLGLTFLANQLSVGLSNDWIDAARDTAVGRQDKPIALGWVAARTVRTAAFVAAALSIAFSLPLGAAAAVAHAVVLASAWSYNVGLKGTAVSFLPYVVSFGLLPLVVTLSRPDQAMAAPWAIALGAMLGLAAHFANVLPDLDDDHRTGVRGLPHRVGTRVSGAVICAALVVGSVLAFVGPPDAPGVAQWVGLVSTCALAGVAGYLVWTHPPSRLLFQLIITAALVNVAVLALSGERLLAG